MIPRRPWRWAPALAFLALAGGCADDRSAGNTTETENLLTAREFRVDSLFSAWNDPDPDAAVATLRLDSGLVDFLRTDSLGRDLSVENDDSAPLPFEVVFWDRRERKGRLRVRIDPATVAGHGRIRIRWGFPLQRRSDPVAVWRAVPDSAKLALTSVFVDDFEGGTPRSRLPGGNTWYCVKDSGPAVYASADSAGKGRSGKALHLAYSLPAFNLAGIALGGEVDFRSLDSLVFWARGTGKLSPTFENLDSRTGGKAWAHRMLDSTRWIRYSIRPGDFDAPTNLAGNVGWEAIRGRVTNLTFIVDGGRDLYLDDIRLYGIDQDDLP